MTRVELEGYAAKHSLNIGTAAVQPIGKSENIWGMGVSGITKNPVDVRASGNTVYGQKVVLVRRNAENDFEVLNDYGTV